jgi:lysozyme
MQLVQKDGSPFKMGDKITQAEADELLIEECKHNVLTSTYAKSHIGVKCQMEKRSCCSLPSNLGAGFYGGDNFNTITKRPEE